MGTIIHGNSNFGFAPIVTESTGGTKSFGTPVMLPGMVSATIEVEQSSNDVYADNIVWHNLKGAKVRTATASFRYIPEEYATYLGYKKADNGGYSDTGSFATHCIFFETLAEDSDGNEIPRLHFIYAVRASTPTVESNTDEDDVEAAEIEVNYTATASDIALDADGIGVQYFYIDRTTENATLFDTFKSAVILPTSAVTSA